MDGVFDVQHLHRIIDAALGVSSPPAEQSAPTVEPSGVDPVALPLAWGDSQLLGQLMPVLAAHLSADALSAVITETRAQLTAGLSVRPVPELHTAVKHCRRCPATGGPHLPVGNVVDPTVVFVHEVTVEQLGHTRELHTALTAMGFTTTNAVHTALVRCQVEDRAAASAQCVSYLFAELQAWQPKLVVLCGSVVNATVLSIPKITAARGQIHWLGMWPFLPVYSWAYAQRTEENLELWRADIQTAHRFAYAPA